MNVRVLYFSLSTNSLYFQAIQIADFIAMQVLIFVYFYALEDVSMFMIIYNNTLALSVL